MSSSSRHHHRHERSERSSRHADEGWSEAIWHEDYQRYYKIRQRRGRKPEYDWLPQSDSTPRTDPVDDITEDVNRLDVHGDDEYGPQHYEAQGASGGEPLSGYELEPEALEAPAEGGYTTSRDSRSRHHRTPHRAPKEEVDRHEYDPSFGEDANAEPPGSGYEGKGKGRIDPHSYDDPQYQDERYAGPSNLAEGLYPDEHEDPYAHLPPEREGETEDPFDAAEREGAHAAFYSHGDETGHALPSTYAEPSAFAEEPYDDPYGQAYDPAYGGEYDGPATQTTGSFLDHITGTPGDVERIDPRYKVEHSRRFKPGSVFKILWAEPTGAAPGAVPGAPTISDVRNISKTDAKFYVGYRRFIVVATDDGHSTCVPILTYDRRGCNKPGVHASKHGIVYTYGGKPNRLHGESRLGFREVAVKMHAHNNEKLAKESRVNYSKLVTIEHNVKVFFIGSVVSGDFKTVQHAVDKCWLSKKQGPD